MKALRIRAQNSKTYPTKSLFSSHIVTFLKSNSVKLLFLTVIIYVTGMVVLDHYNDTTVSFFGLTPTDTSYDELELVQTPNINGEFIKIISFDEVEWETTDNTPDVRSFNGKYKNAWINETDLQYTSCALLQTIHNSNISKIGLFGDSLSRNTFNALKLDFQRNGKYKCKNGNKSVQIQSVQCPQYYYESNYSDHFVQYRVQSEWQSCLQNKAVYKTGRQQCGGIRKAYRKRAKYRNMNVSLYDCNCQPRTDCFIKYTNENEGIINDLQISFLEAYRVYPDLGKYKVSHVPSAKYPTYLWSVGPKLFRDYVSEMDVLMVNLGQHYSSSVHFIQDLTFIADVLVEDLKSAKRSKSAMYRLSYPQHFKNSDSNVHYGLHEFWDNSDGCLEYGQSAERHWTDVLAQTVYSVPKYANISILDYYSAMKGRGDAHEGSVKKDCTHWRHTNEIWKPFQFLLNLLIKHNHRG